MRTLKYGTKGLPYEAETLTGTEKNCCWQGWGGWSGSVGPAGANYYVANGEARPTVKHRERFGVLC